MARIADQAAPEQAVRGPAPDRYPGTEMDDTHPRIRALQVQLLRAFPPARRFAIASELTRAAVGWSRRAVRGTMPGASESEVLLRWIELTYGQALADRVRATRRQLGA
jgi:hypothetical protein